MKKTSIMLLAAALTAGAASPALAGTFQKIGTLDVGYHPDRDTASPDFGGPVERLQLTARGGDVQCRYVRATFGNGKTRDLYSGRLTQGSARTIDLPGDARNIRHITTNCHGFSKGGASIDLYADAGQYIQTWRTNPTWARLWAGLFATIANPPRPGYPAPPRPGYPPPRPVTDQNTNYWVPITTVRFSGSTDRDGDATGFSGKSITTIGLRPIDANARCTSVIGTFGNGVRRTLNTPYGTLSRGQTYKIDLPGGDRNLTRITMRCHAINASNVSIQVTGRK